MGSGLAASAGERPVMKVVRMLQDMNVELESELADDKAVHETISCWCKANDKEKTEAIAAGTAKVAQLEASMSEDAAKVQNLKAKRTSTLAEVNSDIAAKEQASTIRMKEQKAFHAEEVDLMEAVKACQQAIVVLSKHHPGLAQLGSIAQGLRNARVSQLALSSGLLNSDKLDVLKSFLQPYKADPSFLSIPGYQSYAPQSGQIYGVLQTMLENFEAHLSDEQKAERKAQAEHTELMAAKKEEIKSGKNLLVALDEDIAALGEKAAQEAQDLEDTNHQLELDKTFLADVKAKCSETDEEFDARMKSRMDEIAAVADTINILNADEAFDNFGTTVNKDRKIAEAEAISFLQVSAMSGASEQQSRQQLAASVLRRAAKRTGSAQLAALATSAQLDAFTKVTAMIDKLVAELTKQQADEVMQRDWCIAEFSTNEKETAAADDKKANLLTKIADLEKTIESLTKEIADTEATIAETQESMKRASETREAENAGFQKTILDQRLTQSILIKAVDRMKQVYALMQQQAAADSDAEEPEQPGAAHIATSGTHTDAGNGPARFTKYEQNAGGKRVVALLETIVADSKKMEDEALKSEEDSQTAYENLMKDSNKLLASSIAAITNLSESRAIAKATLSMSKTDLKHTLEELEGLNVYLGDLHKSCDFLMKNFDARQAARVAEVDALKDSKAILKGMK
eukprot:CAMPEP_0117528560 /NCGR_PEP_ID=MMETSP0784-20121206/37378_1 /TAXON_ID=39447 /ORGANISM="" /LENGTH=687 /DNA_ID=CAMNT_0005324851 /DNA_START=56 /DNA_END=2119 /DNA_ORIENTATION=-